MKKITLYILFFSIFITNQLNSDHLGACVCTNQSNLCKLPLNLIDEINGEDEQYNMGTAYLTCPELCGSFNNWDFWQKDYDIVDLPHCNEAMVGG